MHHWCFAQPRFLQNSVDFGWVNTFQDATQTLTVVNMNASENLQLRAFLSDTTFTLSTTQLTILPGDSAFLIIKINPDQNVSYKAVVIFSGDISPGQWIVPLVAKGKLSNSYYDATFDLYDEALKSTLKQITGQNYVSLGYNSARDQMYGNLDNVNGNVTCVYTGRTAQFNTRSGATSNNFNCEHTWPQSMFSQNEPMRSDIHHLYSTDETANGKRDNDPFGRVSSPSWSVGGSKWANSVFEPRDEQKGNTARSMFYMAIRYQNYGSFLNSQESVLREWNKKFAPDATSLKRNNGIFALQKNRNPFVDHPGFADRIWSISTTSNRPTIWKYFHTSSLSSIERVYTFTRNIGDTVSVYISNNGTADVVLDSITPPVNAKWLGSSATLKPGENYHIQFTETGTVSMGKPFVIHLKGSDLPDTLHFQLPSTGHIDPAHSNVSLYPNPTPDGRLWLSGGGLFSQIRVLDAMGKEVYFTDISSDLNEIDLHHLSNGIYFVHILSEVRHRTMKVLIQK